MKHALILWTCIGLVATGLALASPAMAQSPAPSSVATGGRLYDKWWTAVPGVKPPDGDHALWASQSTNKRKGLDTWRCKECHGWDYRGKDGAYGSGSHKTGFPGVMGAQAMSVDQLKAVLKGSTSRQHDFSSFLDDTALTNLAAFLKHGLVDLSAAVDARAKKPTKVDVARGKRLAEACTACHGSDGTELNFGKPDKPEYLGTVAKENPWEFVHKARVGQPGSDPPMPTGVELGLSLQDILDILAYSQTLPDK
jgi:thiosulfate dehydrogenase